MTSNTSLYGSIFEGRTALVTGGASGIGAAIVRHLTAAGAHGVVCDLPAQNTKSIDGWKQIDVDVRDEESVANAFDSAVSELGHLDLVVAAAGIVPAWQETGDLDMASWDNVFAVNARGPAATVKHAVCSMADGSAVVVIASMNAWRGDPKLIGYVASKHAVLGFVRSAALDLGPRGIRINAVGPGPVATDALVGRLRRREQEGGQPVSEVLETMAQEPALRRIATVDDIASAVLFLGSDMANGMTGQLLQVDGGVL